MEDEQEAGAKAFEDLNGPALIEAVERLDGGHDEAGDMKARVIELERQIGLLLAVARAARDWLSYHNCTECGPQPHRGDRKTRRLNVSTTK